MTFKPNGDHANEKAGAECKFSHSNLVRHQPSRKRRLLRYYVRVKGHSHRLKNTAKIHLKKYLKGRSVFLLSIWVIRVSLFFRFVYRILSKDTWF